MSNISATIHARNAATNASKVRTATRDAAILHLAQAIVELAKAVEEIAKKQD